MANRTRAQLSTDSATNFPDNTSQLISPQDLRDWITNGIDSFVTQKDISGLENAIYENRGDAIVAGATTDLSLANGNFVHITGTTLITSFGTVQKGARFVLTFDQAANIQASSAIIIPGVTSGNTKTAVANDCCMIISEGGGDWRIVGYFPAAGAGSGLVVDVTATAPLSSTGGTTPDISITQADGTTDGYLSSTDWNTFNGKGDVTASGTPSAGEFAQFTSGTDITTATASAGKLLIGTPDGSTTIQEITLGSNLTMTGSTLNASGGGGGGSGTVTSVGLTMPSAFTVANSPVTTSGTLVVTGAGLASQYVRGDGSLANFPESTGGGSSISYYLNGSVTQLTISGTTYYQMSKTPVLGAGTNFTRTSASGNGYVASFITDVGDPNIISIPGGNFNLEFYFNASSGGGSPQFYAELYKYDGSSLTLIASGSTNPEGITNGTTVDQYFTSISVPTTALALTDRLAVRIYVITSGRNITLHTEDNNLCQVITTISTGLTALNGLTAQVQTFATGTSGTDFAISSVTNTHTFNIPDASASARGLITTGAQTLAGVKSFGNGISAGEIRLLEGSGSGSNYVAVKSPATLGADWSLTLPTTAGTSGYVLQTDGAGITQWALNGGLSPNKYIRSSVQASVTNVLVDTFIQSVLIPAGTYSNGDSFIYNLHVFIGGGGSTGSTTATNVRINNTPAIGGTLIVNNFAEGSGITNTTISQKIAINDISGTQTTAISSIANQSSGVTSSTTINWSVNQYIVVSGTVQTRTKTFLQLAITPL
jgi:hypothetical protein